MLIKILVLAFLYQPVFAQDADRDRDTLTEKVLSIESALEFYLLSQDISDFYNRDYLNDEGRLSLESQVNDRNPYQHMSCDSYNAEHEAELRSQGIVSVQQGTCPDVQEEGNYPYYNDLPTGSLFQYETEDRYDIRGGGIPHVPFPLPM